MTSFYSIENCCCLIIDPGSTEEINYPGRSFFQRSGVRTPSDFILRVKRDLDKIASKPIGRNLLQLIAKRHKGVGTESGKTVTINCGMPTLKPLPGQHAPKSRTFATTSNNDEKFMNSKNVAGVAMLFAGKGNSAHVYYDPSLNYDSILRIKTPSYLALAHELIHAYHYMSGSLTCDMTPLPKDYKRFSVRFPLIEEAKTIGAGHYRSTRISENAIRREHNLEERKYYSVPGDCGSSFLGAHGRAV